MPRPDTRAALSAELGCVQAGSSSGLIFGADDTLDPDVVAALRAFAEPLSGMLPSTGYFSSPSGDVPDTAPLQIRLLDLLGRRP
jgi:hypothetical protein